MPRGVPLRVQSPSLAFVGASTNVVTVDNDKLAGFDPFTIGVWMYHTANTDGLRLFQTALNAGTNRKLFRFSGTTGNIELIVSRATTNAQFITSDTPLAITGRWYCVVATYDSTASPTVKMYTGTESEPLTLRVCGVTATDGSGATNSEGVAGQYRYGNGVAGASLAFPGRLAVTTYFNRALSQIEAMAWQLSALDEPFPAIMSGCRGLWYPGNENGLRVIDYSGFNCHGTVTGATRAQGPSLAARIPMITEYRPRFRAPDAVVAAAGSAYYHNFYRRMVLAA